MDQRRFDDLTRLLGASGTRRGGLRAALGGLLGLGAGAAGLDVESDAAAKRRRHGARADVEAGKKRRRKTCKPACTAGFDCVKVGKKRECQCRSGVTCGTACCTAGQSCVDGVCGTSPEPPTCIAAGEPCKNVGAPCCDGRVCASGQGGEGDVACYVPKTGACERTSDCVYGMSCRGGRCAPPQPGDLGQACDAAAQQLCTTPGAVCTDYTGVGAPAGAHCSLPLQRICTGNEECTCYQCWYTEATLGIGGRGGRASVNATACCHAESLSCAVDDDCCLGLSCVNGSCAGQICAPDGARGCGPDMPCCKEGNGASCQNGVCETCGPATCATGCCASGQCTAYGSQTGASCGTAGAACAACPTPTNACKVASCTNGVCGEANATDGTVCPGGTCVSGSCCTSGCVSNGACVAYASQTAGTCGTSGAACAACSPCKIATCTSGVCGGTNRADGGACTFGGVTGFCKAGDCVECNATTCPDGCCDGGATGICVKTAGMNNGACGTGTAGATCVTCSSTTSCASGVCAAGCTAGTGCDVQPTCPGGTLGTTCWESIKAAYLAKKPATPNPSGAPIVITIAPGVYSEGVINPFHVPDVTFKRCGDCGSVVWQNPAGQGNALIDLDTTDSDFSVTVTIEDIDFKQQISNVQNTTPTEMFSLAGSYDYTASYVYFRPKLVLDGCTFTNADYRQEYQYFGFYMVYADEFSDVEFTGCTFRNLQMKATDVQYAAIVHSNGTYDKDSSGPNPSKTQYNTLTVTDCVFDGISGGKSGPLYLYYTAGTITGSTFRNCSLSNFAAPQGGTIDLAEEGYLTIGTTTISDNVGVPASAVAQGTPGVGAGGGISVLYGYYGYTTASPFAALPNRVSGTTLANVADNAYGNCIGINWDLYKYYTVPCDTWCLATAARCVANADCCSGTCTQRYCV